MIDDFAFGIFPISSFMGTFIFMLLIYIINVYPLYVMSQKANLKNSWIAWIPVLNVIKLFNLAGMSGWFIILTFIPVVGAIVSIIAIYRVFSNFGIGILGCILGIIFSFIGFWYLALSSRRFIANINPKYTNLSLIHI